MTRTRRVRCLCTLDPIRTMILVLSVAIAFSSTIVFASSVKSIKLSELVLRSDVIVVVTVTGTDFVGNEVAAGDEKIPPVRLAAADVVETWKGPVMRALTFYASPRHYCDLASAEKGEQLVLFLERHGASPVMTITHLGRGRMVLQEVKGEQFATIDDKIVLPAGTKTVEKLKSWTFSILVPRDKSGEEHLETCTVTAPVRTIKLTTLRRLVRDSIKAETRENLAVETPRRRESPIRN